MGRPRILIVEDDSRLAATLERVLSAEGHDVVLAVDGLQALRRAREQPPDLVVLDVMLPGLDGIGVCRRLRATIRGRHRSPRGGCGPGARMSDRGGAVGTGSARPTASRGDVPPSTRPAGPKRLSSCCCCSPRSGLQPACQPFRSCSRASVACWRSASSAAHAGRDCGRSRWKRVPAADGRRRVRARSASAFVT